MLDRVWPALLSLALPWVPPGCTYDGSDGGPGSGGDEVGGHAGAVSGSGGAISSQGGSGGAGASSGGAGATSGGADSGTSGVGGAEVLQGSFTLSPTSVVFGKCQNLTAQLLITNISSVQLSWHAVITDPRITFAPPSSTLAAGEIITVAVAVAVPPASASPQSMSLLSPVDIEADVAPSQRLYVQADLNGRSHTPLPPDIDFGEVVIHSPSSQVLIRAVLPITEYLSSSNSAFSLDSITARALVPPGGWNLTFWPSVEGPQETTLSFGTPAFGLDCPPNSIKARGVGIAARANP